MLSKFINNFLVKTCKILTGVDVTKIKCSPQLYDETHMEEKTEKYNKDE